MKYWNQVKVINVFYFSSSRWFNEECHCRTPCLVIQIHCPSTQTSTDLPRPSTKELEDLVLSVSNCNRLLCYMGNDHFSYFLQRSHPTAGWKTVPSNPSMRLRGSRAKTPTVIPPQHPPGFSIQSLGDALPLSTTHHSYRAAQEPADLGNGTEAAAGRAWTGCLPHVATRTHTSSWLWCSCEARSRCVVLQCCVRSCKAGHYPNSNSRLTSAGLLATNSEHLQERVLNLLRWAHKVALPLLWGTGLCGSHRHTSQPLHWQAAPERFWRQP